MDSRLLILAVVIALAGCTEEPCETCGRWRSDAARTLQEVERSPVLTDEQREFFSNGFFGRLVVETKPDVQRAYFPDQSPDDVAWEPWKVVDRSDGTLVIEYELLGETVRRDVELHGDCYRVSQPDLQFWEWFCREP